MKSLNSKKLFYTLIFFIVIAILVFVLRNSPSVKFAEGGFQKIFSTPKSAIYKIGRDGQSNSQKAQQNEKIQKELVDYNLLKRDNDALRAQFQTPEINPQTLIVGKIIGFLGEKNNPTALVINIGQKQGVKKGMAVVFQNYLVGKIINSSQNYSVVITPLNPAFKTLAKLPQTNANGILVGNSDFMLLTQVVITDNLVKDEDVVTKGEVDTNGIGIGPDIVIGKIKSISKNETSPFQNAQIVPGLDYSRLTEVFVTEAL